MIAGVRVGGVEAEEQSETPKNMSDKRIEQAMDAAEDEEDAQAAQEARAQIHVVDDEFAEEMDNKEGESMKKDENAIDSNELPTSLDVGDTDQLEEEEGGTIDDYMLQFVDRDWEYFSMI